MNFEPKQTLSCQTMSVQLQWGRLSEFDAVFVIAISMLNLVIEQLKAVYKFANVLIIIPSSKKT